jgi:hypothetical protein
MTMAVVSTIPPKYDCELLNDLSKAKTKALIAEYNE